MNYHVIFTLKTEKSSYETKTDLTEEQLNMRIIEPYEQGQPIILNGKTIQPTDIDRIRISKSQESSEQIISQIKTDERRSNIHSVIGGHSYSWKAANKAQDVTDEFIKGPIGYKKGGNMKEKAENENQSISNNKVFIVHGHDSELKNNLDDFLRECGLDPIILHRQADQGLTIIEKFEKYSDVAFAFILLTPDDVGMPVNEYENKKKKRKIEHRARQNVIFEFGYFVAKLKRRNVCCLYKKGVTLPTDISGLLYKEVGESIDSIRGEIIKELLSAGLKLKKQ